ncbi:hypothetical protein Fmac_012340 [Flemingia macrophylla]|uniref:Uncharacterized protein n=1 Tax=Flemingia macrophylla TaxID=520843 RepID=A0ABD1MQ19_9FABA
MLERMWWRSTMETRPVEPLSMTLKGSRGNHQGSKEDPRDSLRPRWTSVGPRSGSCPGPASSFVGSITGSNFHSSYCRLCHVQGNRTPPRNFKINENKINFFKAKVIRREIE